MDGLDIYSEDGTQPAKIDKGNPYFPIFMHTDVYYGGVYNFGRSDEILNRNIQTFGCFCNT